MNAISWIYGLLGGLCLALAVSGQTAAEERSAAEHVAQGRTEPGAVDMQFIKDAALGGLAEVRLGKLAAEKGSSVEVQQYGQRMVDDHGRANNELIQLAGVKGITIPMELPPEQRATMDRLSELSGAAFDRAYMQQMVQDHAEAVAKYESVIKNGQDQDIKNFAASTLSVLRDHLQEARNIVQDAAAGERAY